MKITVKELKQLVKESLSEATTVETSPEKPAPPPAPSVSSGSDSSPRTTSQLVQRIRFKVSKISDPRALKTIDKLVDVIIGNIKTLKVRPSNSLGNAMKTLIDKAQREED